MRIDKITIKGFTTYQTEQSLALDELGSGVIAVTGPNGSGKTSLLEAVPGAVYRQTPSRGSIATLATARDARIELEGENGQGFRIRLDCDAHTGRQEAVICDAQGEPLAGPKVKEFDAYVGQHLIPLDVYLASYFSSQTGAGSLFKMSRSDRRALFGRLLGLERLEQLAGQARDHSRATESEMTAARAALDAIASQAEDITRLTQELAEASQRADVAKSAAAIYQDRLDRTIKVLAELEAAAAEVERAGKRAQDARRAADSAANDLAQAQREIASLGSILSRAVGIRSLAAEITSTEVELERIRVRGEAAAAEERAAKDRAVAADRKYQEAKAIEAEALRSIQQLHKALADWKARLERARRATASVPCSGVLKDAERSACSALVGHFQTIQEAEAAIADIEDRIPDADHLHSESTVATGIFGTEAGSAASLATEAKAAAETVRADYANAAKQLAALRANDKSSELTAAEAKAAVLRDRIADLEAKATNAEAEAQKSLAAVPVVDSAIRAKAEQDVQYLTKEVADERSQYETGLGLVAQIGTRLKAATQAQAKAEALREKLAPLDRDLAAYRWLGRALGREGVQALELDAAGPRVSTLANELLADAYGSRFQLRFETQAALANGKGVKETFDIVVVDAERGREGDGEDLSGGEKVIVGEALGLAVGLFHAQSAGANLGTVIRDETVGALDPENGQRYMSMLRAFLRVGRVHQLLMVSHAPAITALADRVINVDNGIIRVN